MPNPIAYEYRRFNDCTGDACDELNKLGLEGWQLIPSTVVVTSAEHPTEPRRVERFTAMLERARDAEVKLKEKADAEAKVKADEQKARDDAAAKTKAAADDAKAKADKAKADAEAKAKLDKAAADKAAAPSPALHHATPPVGPVIAEVK